jgi:prevent-host-death family protein
MHTVTIREAKARLNALVDAAERGEQVVLMRGSRLGAAVVPVSPQKLAVFDALLALPRAMGNPRAHGGLGVRSSTPAASGMRGLASGCASSSHCRPACSRSYAWAATTKFAAFVASSDPRRGAADDRAIGDGSLQVWQVGRSERNHRHRQTLPPLVPRRRFA